MKDLLSMLWSICINKARALAAEITHQLSRWLNSAMAYQGNS